MNHVDNIGHELKDIKENYTIDNLMVHCLRFGHHSIWDYRLQGFLKYLLRSASDQLYIKYILRTVIKIIIASSMNKARFTCNQPIEPQKYIFFKLSISRQNTKQPQPIHALS